MISERRFTFRLAFAAGLILCTGLASSALAQATRTWVSGVGDDANPCSRTAPCKTFAGAISKTAAKGEINVLDPGGFGAVTITKAITISSTFEAGVLVSGTNGVVVNAGPNDAVVLRGLDFEGLGTGLNGINFLAGGSLTVDGCTINDFTQAGISFAPSGASQLFVQDTTLRNNNPSGGSGFAAIFISPSGAGFAQASLTGVRMERNFHGLRVQGNSQVVARDTVAWSNTGIGFLATAPSNTQLTLSNCESFGNSNGIRSDSAGSVVRITDTTVTNNTVNGLLVNAGGLIVSFGNNRIAGNAGNENPSSTIPQK